MDEQILEVKATDNKWGWGYSVTPTGNGTQIETPTAPDYEGTVPQIVKAIKRDKTFQSFVSGGVFKNTRWFYGGMPVVAYEWFFIDYDNPDAEGEWGFTQDARGFDPVSLQHGLGGSFKIMVATSS